MSSEALGEAIKQVGQADHFALLSRYLVGGLTVDSIRSAAGFICSRPEFHALADRADLDPYLPKYDKRVVLYWWGIEILQRANFVAWLSSTTSLQ